MLHCSAHCDFLRGDCHSFSTAETRDWRAVCARKCFDKFGAQNRLHKANILLLVKVKWDDNFGMRYVYIVRAVESNLSCSWSHPAHHDPLQPLTATCRPALPFRQPSTLSKGQLEPRKSSVQTFPCWKVLCWSEKVSWLAWVVTSALRIQGGWGPEQPVCWSCGRCQATSARTSCCSPSGESPGIPAGRRQKF